MYHSFTQGVLQAQCSRTKHWSLQKVMPHAKLMLPKMEEVRSFPSDVERVQTPTYLLARDEDSVSSLETRKLIAALLEEHRG